MQLVIVSSGLRVISLGTTDGMLRDELMAEVGGGMEEDAARGGDPTASVAGGTAQSRGGGTAQSLWTCGLFYCGAHGTKRDCPITVLVLVLRRSRIAICV